MSRRILPVPLLGGLVASLLVAACTSGERPRIGLVDYSKTDRATAEACRQRADEVYNKQNRGAIYAPQYSSNVPLSGNAPYTTVDRNLSAQWGYEKNISDCIRTAGVADSVTTSPGTGIALPQPSAGSGLPPSAKAPPPPSMR